MSDNCENLIGVGLSSNNRHFDELIEIEAFDHDFSGLACDPHYSFLSRGTF